MGEKEEWGEGEELYWERGEGKKEKEDECRRAEEMDERR